MTSHNVALPRLKGSVEVYLQHSLISQIWELSLNDFQSSY